MELKPIQFTVERSSEGRLFSGAFNVRYLPVNSYGLPSNVFLIRPDTLIHVRLNVSGYLFQFDGRVDRLSVEKDELGYVNVITGRDPLSNLLDRCIGRKYTIQIGQSAHQVISDLAYLSGVSIHLGFPDYTVDEELEFSPSDSYASVVQRLITPFQLSSSVNLDSYTESNTLYLVERNLSSPYNGIRTVDYADLISYEYSIVETGIPDKIRLEGARKPHYCPLEEEEEKWENRSTTEESESESRVEKREERPASSVFTSEWKFEDEEASDENGRVVIQTYALSYFDSLNREYFVTSWKNYKAYVNPGGTLNPPFPVPPQLQGIEETDWSASETVNTLSYYDGDSDRKLREYVYRDISLPPGSPIAQERKEMEWEYDDLGDVSKETERVVISRYDEDGIWREQLEKKSRTVTYANDGTYKVRRVSETEVVGGNVRSRIFVERAPFSDPFLRSRKATRSEVEEGIEKTKRTSSERRRGDFTESSSQSETQRREKRADGTYSVSTEQASEEEESQGGEGREERLRKVTSTSERTEGKERSTSRKESQTKTVTLVSKSVTGDITKEITEEQTEESEKELTQEYVDKYKKGETERTRRALSKTQTVIERPRGKNEFTIDPPPPGYKICDDPISVGASEEEACRVFNVAPLGDVSRMSQIYNLLTQESGKRKVEFVARMKPNLALRIAQGLQIQNAPSDWPTSFFYITGLEIEGNDTGIEMRVRAVALI